MRIGVVSDTHNNLKNIDKIITLFNQEKVSLVIHTGDIASANSLQKFSELDSELFGVYGNNDRNEIGIKEVADKNCFKFKEPPYKLKIYNRNIAIFHEPDSIEDFLNINRDIDLVIHGHTHRYRKEIVGGILFFNPGESAGMQKDKNSIGIVDLKSLEASRIFF